MGRQESPQLTERKTQVDTDAQETSRASKYELIVLFSYNTLAQIKLKVVQWCITCSLAKL